MTTRLVYEMGILSQVCRTENSNLNLIDRTFPNWSTVPDGVELRLANAFYQFSEYIAELEPSDLDANESELCFFLIESLNDAIHSIINKDNDNAKRKLEYIDSTIWDYCN